MTGRLRSCWRDGRTAYGLWLSTDCPSSAEALAGIAVDYVVFDLQHGLLEVSGMISMMRAMSRSDATMLCRVPTNEPGIIGRVLDAGAAGVIVPMVDDADLARACVSAARYAPDGARSWGPTRARLTDGVRDVATANADVVVIAMIETEAAVAAVDSIASVPGVDALYVGPSDLSVTLGLTPRLDHDDDRFTAALGAVLTAARENGVVPAIHADPEIAARRASEGFSMVTVVSDVQALIDGARSALDAVRAVGT